MAWARSKAEKWRGGEEKKREQRGGEAGWTLSSSEHPQDRHAPGPVGQMGPKKKNESKMRASENLSDFLGGTNRGK